MGGVFLRAVFLIGGSEEGLDWDAVGAGGAAAGAAAAEVGVAGAAVGVAARLGSGPSARQTQS